MQENQQQTHRRFKPSKRSVNIRHALAAMLVTCALVPTQSIDLILSGSEVPGGVKHRSACDKNHLEVMRVVCWASFLPIEQAVRAMGSRASLYSQWMNGSIAPNERLPMLWWDARNLGGAELVGTWSFRCSGGRKRREVQLFVDRVPFGYRRSHDQQGRGLEAWEVCEAPDPHDTPYQTVVLLFGSVICSRAMFRANRISNKSHAELSEDWSICFLGSAASYLQRTAAGKLSKYLLVYVLNVTLIIDIRNR